MEDEPEVEIMDHLDLEAGVWVACRMILAHPLVIMTYCLVHAFNMVQLKESLYLLCIGFTSSFSDCAQLIQTSQ